MVARTSPPPVADKGDGGAGRNTEQCEAPQASSATMFLTDSGSAKRIHLVMLTQGYFSQFNNYRGVAQLVARVVWDHEAQSSKLCTPTNKTPCISTVSAVGTRSFLFKIQTGD